MAQQFTLGKEISVRLLRDYIIEHKVDHGDTIVLSATNYAHIIEEAKHSPEGIAVPFKILNVLVAKDTTNTVETGKIQIVKNQDLNQ